MQWSCAVILLALYLKFRNKRDNSIEPGIPHNDIPYNGIHHNGAPHSGIPRDGAISNTAIIATAISYSLIILSVALWLYVADEESTQLTLNELLRLGYTLVLSCLCFALTFSIIVPQVYLIFAYRQNSNGNTLGSFSVLGTILQAVAFLGLGVSQTYLSRLSFPPSDGIPFDSREWFRWAFYINATALGYMGLGVNQLIVSGFALGFGQAQGRISL
ncbi:hypothetical protein FQN57_004093 [Myotisia sp. PD_48]|nr:hypothetical protein FQN57_004093 [Myotisia sp. PD_48]